jgi:hypothetical protein
MAYGVVVYSYNKIIRIRATFLSPCNIHFLVGSEPIILGFMLANDTHIEQFTDGVENECRVSIRIIASKINLTVAITLFIFRHTGGRLCRSSENSKANRIETGKRSGGIGEICSVEVEK